jgi:hypothetical protein
MKKGSQKDIEFKKETNAHDMQDSKFGQDRSNALLCFALDAASSQNFQGHGFSKNKERKESIRICLFTTPWTAPSFGTRLLLCGNMTISSVTNDSAHVDQKGNGHRVRESFGG